MKQAILVTAYKNFEHLERIIRHFDDDFVFYIHIDRKSKLPKAEQDMLLGYKRVLFLSRKYKVNWGGFNHLRSILLLCREAIKNEEVEYMHLISGLDFPIKSCAYFKEFMSRNSGKEFLEHFEMPADFWPYGGMDRITNYNFYDWFNGKTEKGLRRIYQLIELQRKLRISRGISEKFPKLYGGSTWWTLSAACLKYVIHYIEKRPSYVSRFRFSFCSEEIFFQTILLNSPYKENICNDNLRFVLWEEKNGNYPANLDETDFDAIQESSGLFARKFEYPVSEGLLEKISYKLNNGHLTQS